MVERAIMPAITQRHPMRKILPLVVVTLILGLAVGTLLGNPALAGISGGDVADSWRCERFRNVSEGDMSEWLARYAPAGPSQVVVSAGGESGGFWMICSYAKTKN